MTEPLHPLASVRTAGAGATSTASPWWADNQNLAADIADGRLTIELVDDHPNGQRDPAADWGRIILGTGHPSPRHWAWVASAIHNADNLLADTSADAAASDVGEATRGDERWCQLAADTFHVLRYAGAYAHIPDPHPDWCHADPAAVETWLAAPTSGGNERTVGDVLDVPLADLGATTVSTGAIDRLLSMAQDAGVFGVPDDRVELHHVYPDADAEAGLVVVTRPVFGYLVDLDDRPGRPPYPHTTLALDPPTAAVRVRIDDLLPRDVTGVDAAVTLLTRAAEMINTALQPDNPNAAARVADRAADRGATAGAGVRVAPFPPLRLDPSQLPGPAAPPPSNPPHHGRQR